MGIDEAAAAGLRARRLLGWLLIVAGIGVWLPLLIPLARNLRLELNGTRVRAVVTDQRGTERPLNYGAVFRVAYSWRGTRYSSLVRGSTTEGLLSEGDRLIVLIDPAHPGHAQVPGQWFYDFSVPMQWVVAVELVAGVWVGLAMVVVGTVWLARVRRQRTTLASASWRSCGFRSAGPYARAPLSRRSVLAVEVDRDSWQLVALRGNTRRTLRASGLAGEQTLQLVLGSSRARAVIRSAGSRVLVSAQLSGLPAPTGSGPSPDAPTSTTWPSDPPSEPWAPSPSKPAATPWNQ